MNILLAIDGTNFAQTAVQMISQIKLSQDSQLKIISVVDMTPPVPVDAYGGFAPQAAEMENVIREQFEQILNDAKQQIAERIGDSGVVIETEVLVGAPEKIIVEAAEEMQADLIVVGSHGYNRWERLLIGSVSDSVAHHAPCSVLIVRAPKE